MANKKKYKIGEIKDILEGIYNNPEIRRSVVPMFMSDSGMGKTFIIEEFMREKGVYRPPFVLSQRMPFEISGMALVDKELDKMKYYDFDSLLTLQDGDILFIDETYNANPNTLAAFLTFLESRIMISGRKLPNIMIVAAANPQGIPPLTPQIRRRFLQYDIEFDNTSWKKYMAKKYFMPFEISEKLCNFIKNEGYSGYNYDTPADIDKAVNMIIHGIPTPYEDTVKPVLETMIENKKGDLNLPNLQIAKGEMFKWLNLAKVSKNINIEIKNEEVNNITKYSNYEIEILNKDKEVIGYLKSIEEMEELYYFSKQDLEEFEKKGIIFIPSSPLPPPFFLSKKNN